MLSSSEDEVIVRKSKPVKKRNLENMFDSSVSDDLSLIEDESSEREYQPISRKKLIEYFGTGKEYFYCLEEQKVPLKEEKEEIKDQRILNEELLSFLVENLEIDYSVLKETAQMLIDGCNVQFIVFGYPQFDLTISVCYKIFDLIEFYFSNPLVIEKLKKIGNFNFNFIPFIIKEGDFNSALYKFMIKNNVLISKSKLKENLIQQKRIYAPEDSNDSPEIILEEFYKTHPPETINKSQNIKSTNPNNYNNEFSTINSSNLGGTIKYAAQVIANEYFRDFHLKDCVYEFLFNNLYLQINNRNYLIKEIKENCSFNLINEIKLENYKIIYTSDFIKRIFINNNFESEWNVFRELIIDNLKIEINILKNRIRNYLNEISKTILFENILDRIVNGRITTNRININEGIKENEFYISMSIESINIQVSVVNNNGELIEFKLFNSKDINSVNELMEIYKVNELIISKVKRNQIIKFLEKNLIYAEGSLVRMYSNSKTFTHNVVRMLLSPETELAYMINNNISIKDGILSTIIPKQVSFINTNDSININESSNSYTTTNNSDNVLFLLMLLTNKEANEAIVRAIQTGLSIVGVDINQLLTDKRKRELINFIPDFYFSDKIKEYNSIDSLELIQNIYSEEISSIKINNILTFLRCKKSDTLDSFPIHPILYKKTRTLCAAALGLEQTDPDNKSKEVNMFLAQGGSINISHLSKELRSTFIFLRKVLEDKYYFFTGLPDTLVFNDLVVQLFNCIYEGSVFEVKERFLLVNVLGAICYIPIKSSDNYFINQLIKVRIIKKNIPKLTYEGEIYLETKNNEMVYEEDKFYLCRINNELYLHINLIKNITYIIRTSTTTNDSNKKCLQLIVFDKVYDDIEELKLKLLKPLFINLKKVQNNINYYINEDLAINSLKNTFDYAFYLSKEYPGYVVFVYKYEGVKKEYLKMTDKFVYSNKVFEDLDEFMKYRKSI